MKVARESRGFQARSIRSWPVLATTAGALFIRSYERGERVHLAMLSRGYTGQLPVTHPDDGERRAVATGRHTPGRRALATLARGGGPVSAPVLDVQGLAYAYPDGHQALFGVNLHVHQGERVALLGPNGAGKTTLVLHLNGILTAGAGSVSVSGPAGDQGQPDGDPAPGRRGLPGPRRPAVHAVGAGRRGVRAGQPRPARGRPRGAGRRRARPGRDGRLHRPPAAPPVVRAASSRRGGDRAGDGARDPRARRAVVQPRPGLSARAGRHRPRRSTSPS